MKISSFIFILLICCSCSTETAWRKARFQYFATKSERDMWTLILAGICAGTPQERDKVRSFVGNTIILEGCAWNHRDGITSDLRTDDGIQIDIDLVPNHNVYPPGPHGTWCAEVRGIFQGVDFEKRVIHITAKPKDYHVMAVY
jgi:hypothetical protein